MPNRSTLRIDHARLALRVAVLAAAFASPLLSQANSPAPDLSFGTYGIVDQPFAGMGGMVSSMIIQRDGGIWASGSYVFTIALRGIPVPRDVTARYEADGSIDLGFGGQGVLADTSFKPALLQRDGKVVSSAYPGLRRLNADGSPDTGFIADGVGGTPVVIEFGGILAQQADGRIVGAGYVSRQQQSGNLIGLVRYNVDGSLDTTFNSIGFVIVPNGDSVDDSLGGLTIQPDGKLVVAATSIVVGSGSPISGFTLIRYNADGTEDLGFGNQGRAFAATATGINLNATEVVRQPDGRLIVAGTEHDLRTSGSQPALLLVGFTSAGELDAGFGTDGKVKIDIGSDHPEASLDYYVVKARALPDGKFLVAFGPEYTVASQLMRFTASGVPDATFGDAGVFVPFALPQIKAIGLLPDGDVILGGVSSAGNFALVRYTSGPVPLIEYYNAALDHYFLSMNPQEVDDLDLGVHPGWKRSGQMFSVYGNGSATVAAGIEADPACRFYIPPQHGDSHFFSIDPAECIAVQNKVKTDPNYSGYVYETSEAFYATLPSVPSGACPAAMVPVYRLWNQRVDSNHRYTADPVIKAQMIAKGYVAEGYGPDSVAMCVPQ